MLQIEDSMIAPKQYIAHPPVVGYNLDIKCAVQLLAWMCMSYSGRVYNLASGWVGYYYKNTKNSINITLTKAVKTGKYQVNRVKQ